MILVVKRFLRLIRKRGQSSTRSVTNGRTRPSSRRTRRFAGANFLNLAPLASVRSKALKSLIVKDLRDRPCASAKSLITNDLSFQSRHFCAGCVPIVSQSIIKLIK